MKKYRKTLPIISLVRIAIALFCASLLTAVVWLWLGKESEWTIICIGVCSALMTANLFVIIPYGCQYSYDDFFIKISYIGIVFKRISYSEYESVFISNASYNNNYGFGVYGNIPIQYSSKGKDGTIKTAYPFITLHKSGFPVKMVKSGMSSRDLFMLNCEKTYCLGICWFDSLAELLNNTDIPIYVLEDVYLRFKDSFDSIIIQHKNNVNRVYIVTGHGDSLREP